MPYVKTLIKKYSELYFPSIALILLFLCTQSNWIYTRLYFNLLSLENTFTTLTIFVLFIYLLIFLLAKITNISFTLKCINLAIIFLFLITVFFLLFNKFNIKQIANSVVQLAIIVIAATACFTIYRKKIYSRLYPAISLGACIFLLFPIILSNFNSTNFYWPYLNQNVKEVNIETPPQQNTIVLLFDELSSTAIKPILDEINKNNLFINYKDMQPAGENTLNVIPTIITNKKFDKASACGTTQICSGSNILDFSKITASSPNIDIVGFYHKYCAIKGLRSCYFEPPALNNQSGISQLSCNFINLISLKKYTCNYNKHERYNIAAQRKNMELAVLRAPFWNHGGILYAHLMLPHLPMGINEMPLKYEYQKNVEASAELLGKIIQKAKLNFGADFKIIIFSDHPLRPALWCQSNAYKKSGCEPLDNQVSSYVPAIIASPDNNKVKEIAFKSASEIFLLLYNK